MLHRYSGSQNITSPTMASTFSLFFPLAKGHLPEEEAYDDHSSITSPSSPSSSSTGSVDCTLSLGTPSSRGAEPERRHGSAAYPSSGSTVSWDVAAESYYCQNKATAGAGKGVVVSAGHDPLMSRRCANCGTTSTPLWRNGPRGPKSLCNACGIRFKKEERRAAATAESGAGGTACGFSAQRAQGSAAKAPHSAVTYGEETLPCGDVADAPFLAWRLDVVPAAPATAFSVWPERTSLFQYN